MSVRSSSLRFATLGGGAALVLLAVAGPASAHVTANPKTAEQGSYTKVTFRVPNEEQTAKTVQLEVDLPLDHPIASVSVRPVPGWTVKAEESTLPKPIKSDDGEVTKAVSKITWSGGTIDPGQFQEFDVSMGPLPTDTDTLVFKAIQTYTGGEVVRWDEIQQKGAAEPEHPAPTVHLTKAETTENSTGSAPATAAPVALVKAAKSDDGTARLLGILGLAAGLLGLAAGALALVRSRARA
jgi:uncharacterized protein YcnI